MVKKIILLSLSVVLVIKCEVKYNFINQFDIPIDIELEVYLAGDIYNQPMGNKVLTTEKFTLKEKSNKEFKMPEGIPLKHRDLNIKFLASGKGLDKIEKSLPTRWGRPKPVSKNIILRPAIFADIKDMVE